MVQAPAAFVSTASQRMAATALFASCGALVARGGVGVWMDDARGDPLAWGGLVAAAALAYWLSDLGTGVFHWWGCTT